jgi:uncharacterized protein YecE (DUF72 family)
MATVRIGISGWRYAPWRGVFYPEGLPQRNELAYASSLFASIEINGSFYSLQKPASYGAWAEATPERFAFSVKGPRFITHILRLEGVETPLANFFASGVLRLGAKLGPMLWQFPPSFRYDAEKMEAFFALLPRDARAAAAMAARHDNHLKAEPWLRIDDPGRPLRHAVEIRHESFTTPDFVAQLRRHGVALVVADTAGRWPLMEDVTADFVYVRLHGDEELYASGYSDEALADWARRIEAWRGGGEVKDARRVGPAAKKARGGREVFVYFDNDVKVHAPYDAMKLAHRLGLGPEPLDLPAAGSVKEVPRVEWPCYGGTGKKRAATRARG